MNERIVPSDILEECNVYTSEAERLLQQEAEKCGIKIVVLDDDPTGVQTVHDISVFTDWTEESIRAGFEEDNKAFYILTNSRGFSSGKTRQVHLEIARNIAKVARETGRNFIIISRSDSTLRGHFPLETQTLRETLVSEGYADFDGEILCPFFPEGGRFTFANVHYVKYGDELVPAGQTEFAGDRTFGYSASDLREYVEEKTEGRYSADSCICVSLEDLRSMNIEKLCGQLLAADGFRKIIVNALDYTDLKVFCVALYKAIGQGKRFMFRTAAGFVKVMACVSDRPLLTRDEMVTLKNENGGIIVVGSHTKKTTAQLKELLTLDSVVPVEFNSSLVLEGEEVFENEIERVVQISEALISDGKTPVCYTGRTLITCPDDTPESALARSVRISEGVQALVGRLKVTPSFVIAKGGITSSDVGTKALKVKKALVLGQICPGIPVWQTGRESSFPGIPYVIFPGNVGDADTLRKAAEILINRQ